MTLFGILLLLTSAPAYGLSIIGGGTCGPGQCASGQGTITSPSVSCTGSANVVCAASFTFNNVNDPNCQNTQGCALAIAAWACRVATSPPSQVACTQSWQGGSTAFPYLSVGQWGKVSQALPGSSVSFSQSFASTYYPTFFFLLQVTDSQGLVVQWTDFNAGVTVAQGAGPQWNLIMEPTGYSGCTTTPAQGTTQVSSGTVQVSASANCPVNAGTATFSQFTFYTGTVSGGQESWSQTGTSNSNPVSYTVSADTEVFASYSCSNCGAPSQPYSLLIQAGSGISLTPSTTQTINQGGSASFTIAAQSGYSLPASWQGWSVIGCAPTTPLVGTSLTPTITYAQIQNCAGPGNLSPDFWFNVFPATPVYNPTFNVLTSPGTGVTIVPSSASSLTSGGTSTATWSFTAQTGFTLSGWSGYQVIGCSALSPITGTASTLTLTYSQLQGCLTSGSLNTLFYVSTGSALNSGVTLIISSSTGGTTNPAAGTTTQAAGSQVTITETPSSGYQFYGWEVISGSQVTNYPATQTSITVTMPSSSLGVSPYVNVAATFVQTPPSGGENLIIACTQGGTTSPPCGTIPETGTFPLTVQVSATPLSGWNFCGWTLDGSSANGAGQALTSNPIGVTFTGSGSKPGSAPENHFLGAGFVQQPSSCSGPGGGGGGGGLSGVNIPQAGIGIALLGLGSYIFTRKKPGL